MLLRVRALRQLLVAFLDEAWRGVRTPMNIKTTVKAPFVEKRDVSTAAFRTGYQSLELPSSVMLRVHLNMFMRASCCSTAADCCYQLCELLPPFYND